MSANTLATEIVSNAEYQIAKSIEGLSDEEAIAPAPGSMMTIREQVAHLYECYHAVLVESQGSKYAWGTTPDPGGDFASLVSAMWETRTRAIDAALECLDNNSHLMQDFIIGHDFYHVGQICAVRAAITPGWSSYSIYK